MSRSFVLVTLLVVATFAAFEPLRHNDFINYDDDAYITANPHVVGGLTLENARWAFTSLRFANWIPLTWISHQVDVSLFGLDPAGHHLVNLAFHLANALLLYFLLLRLIGRPLASFAVALLFAVHPLRVESVAWAAERKDTLSTFFGLLAMVAYVSYVRRPGAWRYAGVLALFACSLMSKAMLVTLPFLLLLLDYWPLGRISRRAMLEKLPLLALSAAASVISIIAGRSGAMAHSLPLTDRLANALVSYVGYLANLFWPVNLGLGYPHPGLNGRGFALSTVILSAAILLAISAAVWALRRRAPYLLVGWCWFVGALVPVIGLVQVGTQAMADRFTYVPLIGIFIMAAFSFSFGGGEGAALAGRKSAPLQSRLVVALLVALATSCIVLTRRQVSYWQNSLTLFTHSARVIPESSIARFCLGQAWTAAGEPQRAINEYVAALKLQPNDPQTHNNLGSLRFDAGNAKAAIEHYQAALAAWASYAEAHNNLANALTATNQHERALHHYRQALRLDPDLAQAHNNLGLLLAQLGRIDEAIGHFRSAIRLDPEYASAQVSLALALAMKGDPAAPAAIDGAAAVAQRANRPDLLQRVSLARERLRAATRPN